MSDDCRSTGTDRYVSFRGLECNEKASRIMQCLDRHLALPGRRNAFWEYFGRKRSGGSGPRPDELFLIHANVNEIRELFAAGDDPAALQLLLQIEEECC